MSAPLTIGFGGEKDWISVDSSGAVGYRLGLAPIDAALELAGRGVIRVRLPSVLATGGGGVARLLLGDGAVTAGFASLAAEGIAGRLGWGPGTKGEARLTVARARHTGAPALIAPLALEIEALFQGDKAEFSIRSMAPVMSIVGRHDFSRARGTADLRLEAIRFAPGEAQPGTLAPVLAGIVEDAEGALGATGKITWDAKGLDPRVVVDLDRLGFAIGIGHVSDITVRYSRVPPSDANGLGTKRSAVRSGRPRYPRETPSPAM